VELIALVKRYSGKSGAGKEKWFCNHWIFPAHLMRCVHEAFASPLNVQPETKVYGVGLSKGTSCLAA